MWPICRLCWKRTRLAAAFLAFLGLLFLFSYGLFYAFDKKLVGGLLAARLQQPPNRRRGDAVLKQQESLLAADIFPADPVKGEELKREAVEVKGALPNYNVHIFYYGW
jgi:hypothetical protein